MRAPRGVGVGVDIGVGVALGNGVSVGTTFVSVGDGVTVGLGSRLVAVADGICVSGTARVLVAPTDTPWQALNNATIINKLTAKPNFAKKDDEHIK